MRYYKDYRWKEGSPVGVEPVEEIANADTYKIVADPYNKRISIEKYVKGQFNSVIYDSILLDFRHLRKPELTAWLKLPIAEQKEQLICLIRDQDDRVLYREIHTFDGDLCRQCRVETPQSQPLSYHRMYYTQLGDPFNGVVLYDLNNHAVMRKTYDFDDALRQFTTLLSEQWELD